MLIRLSKLILDYPKSISSIIVAITIVFGYIAFFSSLRLQVDFSLEQMFPNNDSGRDIYEQFKNEFSREDDLVLLTYEGTQILSRESIEKIDEITEALEFLDGVEQVISLSNIQNGDYFDLNMSEYEWNNNS